MAGLENGADAHTKDNALSLNAGNEHAVKLSQEASLLTSYTSSAVPETAMARVGLSAAEALNPVNLAKGAGNALLYDCEHPMEVVKTLAGSAALAAVIKTVLPEGGPAGRIAGAALGGYFLYQTVKPMEKAVSEAANAQNMDQIHNAALDMDNTAGSLAVNSVISIGGYKLGAGAADHVLLSERLDGFSNFKDKLWNTKPSDLAQTLGLSKPDASLQNQLVRLRGSEARISPHAESLGDAIGDQPMDITVFAKSKATDLTMTRALQRVLTGRSDYSTAKTYDSKFGASSESMDAIQKFAEQSGLKASEIDPRSGRVVLSGTVDDMSNAFNVKLQSFQTKGPDGKPIEFKAFQGQISVPKYLADGLDGIYGLDTPFVARPNISRFTPISEEEASRIFAGKETGTGSSAASSDVLPADLSSAKPDSFIGKTPDSESFSAARRRGPGEHSRGQAHEGDDPPPPAKKPIYYTPRQVADMYNFPKTGGKGQAVGIIELGGGLDPADNSMYYQALKQPEPKINTILVDGAEGKAGVQPGPDGEVALDSQVIGAVAPDAVQNLIYSPNSKRGFIDAIDRATFEKEGETPNQAISISWGSPENVWSPMSIRGMSRAFQKAALKGISTFVASGDAGAVDGSPDGSYQVNYPASDPFVTATGGTKLLGQKNADGSLSIKKEVAWNELSQKHGATGGGVSQVFDRPPYQSKIEIPPNANGGDAASHDGRGVPDVAGDADGATGYVIRAGGHFGVVGGTSAVAPLYAALTTQLNEGLGRPVGFLNPKLYALGISNPSVFNDISQGNNNGYNTGKGWDAVTGWGSINGQALLDALKHDNADNAGLSKASTRIRVKSR